MPDRPDPDDPETRAVVVTAAEHGFDLVGVVEAAPPPEDHARLAAWLAAGHGAGMAWMGRAPAARTDPRTLLPGARSVVVVAVAHPAGGPALPSEGRFGQVARYARGRDYHEVVPPRLRALATALAARFGGARTRVACDTSALLERALAARAGLGFVGRNACLIRPGRGSWTLLGAILLDVDLPSLPAPPNVGCGRCRRCLDACPTGAFPAPYVLDPRRCVSYLTVEHRGPIPRPLRAGLGEWVFGCDACQEVCPYNRAASVSRAPAPWPELRPEAGVGARLDLAATLALATDDAFRRRFAGTPLLRPKRSGLLRNAAVVARNVGATAAVPALETRARQDPEPVVRGHALHALLGIDPPRGRALAERSLATDDDPFVRAEAEAGLAEA